jgi:aspartyl-tRNA synthetase
MEKPVQQASQQQAGSWKRTHTCGELRASDIGKTVTLNGWVHVRRDLGGVIFIDLRDRYGKTQVVFNPQYSPEAHAAAEAFRSEYVISVTGLVERRPEGTANPLLPTGEIDVLVHRVQLFSRADTPPFPIEDDIETNEDVRLRYRFLDLRRPELQRNLMLRSAVYQTVHRFFQERGFVEVETPVLMKSTPEGARDYLVPSRVQPGKFYALPQSPQTYKQLLMASGLDRYVQIVKCFRDEDLRADRQPEFTQIDLEMSFVDAGDVRHVAEDLVRQIFLEARGIDVPLPLAVLTYQEAIETYGTDKPDRRFGLTLACVNDAVRETGFRVFADAVRSGGVVAGFALPGGASYTRNQLDNLVDFAKNLGAGGLVWVRWTEAGLEAPVQKFLGTQALEEIARRLGARQGDLLLLVSDTWQRAYGILGSLRLELGRRHGLIDESAFDFLWVVDFPLVEYSQDEGRYIAMHHPFTSPHMDDLHLMDANPGAVRSLAYDLVINGAEIAGGSIRIHEAALQRRMFALLGISPEESERRFGFLLNAFRFGAPPHGGIAFGFDRLIMLLSGTKSLRDVIAFPKTASASSLMDEAPSEVDEKQLRELHIRVI